MAAAEETGRSGKDKDEAQDTEITLGTGKLLGIFFALVIVCSVFFTMGYLLGRSTSAGGKTEIVSSGPTSGSTAGKPSGKNSDANSQNSFANNTDNSTTTKNQGSQPQATASPTPARTPEQSNPAAFASGSYMVQVAAVSKHEDAEILVSALQKKQYPVFIANVPGDPLFHVQVGPFSDPKEAESMRNKLSSDGYNAIVKK
jgi:cell division septation protein DedD